MENSVKKSCSVEFQNNVDELFDEEAVIKARKE